MKSCHVIVRYLKGMQFTSLKGPVVSVFSRDWYFMQRRISEWAGCPIFLCEQFVDFFKESLKQDWSMPSLMNLTCM